MSTLSDALELALNGSARAGDLARAKINLALHVTGRRSDGYHNIETLAVFADLGDVVTAEPSSTGRMSMKIEGRFGKALTREGDPRENLVIRAAEELAKVAQQKSRPTTLMLTKRIPIAAGLGGGSADAAATLRLLNSHWDLGLGEPELAAIGVKLGADIPMCLASQPLIASGIGDVVRPVAGIPALPVVLAYPGGGVPTVSVYKALEDVNRPGLPPLPEKFPALLDFIFWLRQSRNDLGRPAAAVSSAASAAAKALIRDRDCLFARMSGSGSSGFGIFVSLKSAERAAERIAEANPDWWVVATMTGGSEPAS